MALLVSSASPLAALELGGAATWLRSAADGWADLGDGTALPPLVRELLEVFSDPYGEQKQNEAKYFRKAPDEVYENGGCGGTAFMT